MGQRTEYKPGTFSWVELATTDPDGAKSFYGELFGWKAEDVPTGEAGVYTMCTIGDQYVGAMMRQGDQERKMGVPPHWNNYVTVESVDDAAAKATELGATLAAEPFDVMEAGRMAVIQDPVGAFIAVWEAKDHPGAGVVNEPGAFTWNDLNTSDPDRAQEFYEGLFGWSFEKVGGDEVDYRVIRNGERSNGGMMRMGAEQVTSFWIPYFAVENVDETTERATSAGGGHHAGPIEVPNGGRFAVLHDPAAAVFGVIDGEFDD